MNLQRLTTFWLGSTRSDYATWSSTATSGADGGGDDARLHQPDDGARVTTATRAQRDRQLCRATFLGLVANCICHWILNSFSYGVQSIIFYLSILGPFSVPQTTFQQQQRKYPTKSWRWLWLVTFVFATTDHHRYLSPVLQTTGHVTTSKNWWR